MKINRFRNTESGSALLLTLVATVIIGATLAAYLTLVKAQNQAGMRSQAWNATIPIIEAGMEDAMMHLNTHGSSNLLCDGWTQVGTKYVMQRALGDSYYNVSIYNWVAGASNQHPIIDSRGYVTPPLTLASIGGPTIGGPTMFAMAVPASPAGFMARGVRATSRQDFVFTKAMVAKCSIDLAGNNIRSDSFDSSDPSYSTGGRFDATKAKAHGDIATDCTIINSISVGNADVYGHLSTGPGGSVAIGPNGSVGDATWHDPNVINNVKGIQPGAVTDDMNTDFPDVKIPFTGGYVPYIPTNGLGNGNYQVSSYITGSDVLDVTGNAVLYVTGDFAMSGNAQINIAAGASLKLYVGGAGSIGGNGIINNNDAMHFIYYGLPTSTTLSFAGNSLFVGCIYAPNADFTLSGSGNTVYDFCGASVTKTVTMNGHFHFHYDEALSKYGPYRGFILTSWNEMNPTEVANAPLP